MLCFCLFSLRAITPSYGIFDGDNKQHSLNKLLFAPIAHKKAMLVYVILCACISRSLLKCSVCLLQTYYGGGVNYCITKEELFMSYFAISRNTRRRMFKIYIIETGS